MKKSVLFFLIAFISIGAKAQTFDWQVLSTAGTGLFTSASNTYSIAYFKGGEITDPNDPLAKITVGPRVYVATREATSINVLNAETGALERTITGASTTGGGYKNTRIRATETGEIYSVTMRIPVAVASDDQFITVGYMKDENSPFGTLNFPYPTGLASCPRMGDSFEVVGSGNDATFFIGGSGTNFIYIYKRNGAGVDFVRSVDMGADLAAQSISVIPNVANLSNSDFLVSHNTTSTPRKLFKYDSGTSSYTNVTLPVRVHDLSAANNFSQLKYFNISGQGYLATTGGSTDPSSKHIKIFKIVGTDYSANASFELVKTLSGGTYTYVSGNVGFSDLVFSKNIVPAGDFVSGKFDLKLYQLVTRNAISAYTLNFVTGGTLPVTLTSFTASLANNQNTLNWATSSENNSLGFEIESSADGLVFNKIGFVPSKSSGNSSAMLSYSFQDKSANTGTTYFRLKQIDKDGKFEYSDIKFVKSPLAGSSAFAIYPNPTTDYVEIAGANAAGITMQLFTTTGKEVNITNLVQGSRLNMAGLNAGIYVLSISENGRLLQTSKVVKK